MTEDIYYTIDKEGEGLYKEKMSRFLAFALPVNTAEEAKNIVKDFQNRYHDARHVCWAYMLGPRQTEWQLNDNGEPSGTAGKPILGQIKSRSLTNVLVVVVRYFGGIKLGTSGLISAYKEAASLALDDSGIRECYETERIKIEFSYVCADSVMKIIKSFNLDVVSRQFDNLCSVEVDIRKSVKSEVLGRLEKIENVSITQ